ncbi:Eco57I restriction-modification methylase domain-containing protein [Micromonospora chalcea]
MSRLSRSSPVSVELIRWIDSNQATPLDPRTVPGASTHERHRLATLGALARHLAEDAVNEWPNSLRRWAGKADLPVPETLVRDCREAILRSDSDLLADTYEQLVSGRNRRLLGTFFTPPSIVTYMIAQANSMGIGAPAHVVDPGSGVGAFTTAIHATWPDATIHSVDLNVVTLGLLATRVAVEQRSNPTEGQAKNIQLVHNDYLAWLKQVWPKLSGPRLIIGNPPYTRHQEMTENAKAAGRAAAGNLISSGLAGLSAYFLAASINSLKSSDSLVLLLPGSWLETRYGRELREWLWHSRRRRIELDLFPSQVEVFPGTQVTAMVLSLGPERRISQPFIVRSVTLSAEPKPRVTRLSEKRPTRDGVCPMTFTRFVRTPTRPSSSRQINLGSVAKIRRGVATGANNFFFLSDSRRQEANLSAQFLRPALVKASHCKGAILTIEEHRKIGAEDIPRWLLDLNNWDRSDSDQELLSYLLRGKRDKVHQTYLAKKRRNWDTVENVQAPHIFIAPVGKAIHRVIVNAVGAVSSNNLYGIYLFETAPWDARTLATWLSGAHGQDALRALSREYQGGSSKIEPKSLRFLEVPETLLE